VSDWVRKNKLPVTNLYMTFYFSGISRNNLCTADGDGTYTLGLPAPDQTVVPGVPVEQTGEWVAAALEEPEKWTGQCGCLRGNRTTG
jgi:hypothetical protein